MTAHKFLPGQCPSSRAIRGCHEPKIEGTQQSDMTWYRCALCGAKAQRGQGIFHNPSAIPSTADTPYVEVDGVTYVARWHENKSSYVVQTKTPEQIASRMMVAARNAQMFQDVRSIVATCADLKARAPYRHIEAQRVLPLLDSFLGEGYTGRVLEFKRMLEAHPPQPEAQSVRDAQRVPRVETQDYFVRLVERYGMAMWESRNDEAVRLKIELCTRYGDMARHAALKSAPPQKPVSDEVKP